jgi:ABC-type polysaccharide/polyol phosphate export permease
MFVSRFDGRLHLLLKLNPLVYVVRGYRDSILGNQFPAWQDLAILSAFSVGSFVVGGLFFRYSKRGFADVL